MVQFAALLGKHTDPGRRIQLDLDILALRSDRELLYASSNISCDRRTTKLEGVAAARVGAAG